MDLITIEKELKIRNVSSLWSKIREEETKPSIDCSELEKVDGAGFQLLHYLNIQEYKLIGISEDLMKSLVLKGFKDKEI